MAQEARSDIGTSHSHVSVGRRQFLGNVAEAAAASLVTAEVGQASPTLLSGLPDGGEKKSDRRIEQAYEMREQAALYQKRLPVSAQATNGDENLYVGKIASYTKGLPHDELGRVIPGAYQALVAALSGDGAANLENVPLGGDVKLSNPQAGLGFELAGADSHQFTIAAPPRFSSAEQAGEMVELYWQALTRDVPFSRYETDPLTSAAVGDLSRLSNFRGSRANGQITPQTLFRGTTPGDLVGPYISQLLWLDVPYGVTTIVQRIGTAMPGIDYMVRFDNWLAIQNGAASMTNRIEATQRYIRSARDLARYVHQDFTYQAFLNACLILLGTNAPFDAGNPYKRSTTQSGFSTFGAPHILDLLAKVANYGLKASWYQKWYLHRRLRPEEFGGALNGLQAKTVEYSIHAELLNSPALEIAFSRSGTYLLPQAYSEGCPTHPSYPAGHAVIAGACATVLKAFFDESFEIHRPVEASADGLSLGSYRGPRLTVGGELNKLAANIAMARNAAGIHWRSDAMEGLRLGEAVALSLMKDEGKCFSETFDGFGLTKFDGARVVV